MDATWPVSGFLHTRSNNERSVSVMGTSHGLPEETIPQPNRCRVGREQRWHHHGPKVG